MADSTVLASSRRVNVLPTSTILNQRFEDVDCSGTSFDKVPEDGQFILAAGKTGVNPYTGYTFAHDSDPSQVTVSSLAYSIVYTGGSNRSDIQALGSKRIPVIRGNMRITLKSFIVPDSAVTSLKAAGNGYSEGALLTLGSIDGLSTPVSIQGTDNRVYVVPVSKAVKVANNFTTAAVAAIIVGRVSRVVTDSIVAGTGEIEVELFQHPYVLNVDAN